MILFACLSLLLYVVSANKCAPATPELSWEAKLGQDLETRCPTTRHLPPAQVNGTVVTTKFILKKFYFDAGEETFDIFVWLSFHWTDSRLKWDPKDYGNIDKTKISTTGIWTPMESFNNRKSANEFYFIWTSSCEVTYDGTVHCLPRGNIEVKCISKLRDWPYDTQRCRFEFDSQRYHGTKPVFTFGGKRGMSMLGAEYGGGWNIVDYEQGEDPNADAQLHFVLLLERQAVGLGVMLVAPAIVIVVLTVTVLLLDVQGSVRLVVLCLSLLSHFCFMELINNSIPQHSRDSPTILIYFRTSLIITSFSLVLTLILNKITQITIEPPGLLTMVNTWAFNSPIRYVLRSSSQTNSVTETVLKRHNSEWIDFVSLVQCLFLSLVVILYLIFYIMYVPRPPPLV